MKCLLFFVTIFLLSNNLAGQIFTYNDSLGNTYSYDISSKYIPTKFDTTFLASQIIAPKLGIKQVVEYGKSRKFKFTIHSIVWIKKSIYRVRLSAEFREQALSSASITFEIKWNGNSYIITQRGNPLYDI